MFCTQCGSKNNDDSIFCSNCGTRNVRSQNNSEMNQQDNLLEQPNNSFVQQNHVLNQPTSFDAQSYNQQQYSEVHQAQPDNNLNSQTQVYSPLSMPKKRRAPMILAIAGGSLAIILLLALLFSPKLTIAVMGHEAYYVKAEKEFMKDEFSSLSDLFKQIYATPYHSESDIRFKVKGLDNLSPAVSDALNLFSIHLISDTDPKAKKARSKADFIFDNETLLQAIADQDNKFAGISFPEYSDKQFIVPTQNINIFDEDELNKITGLTVKERKKLSKQLFKNIIDNSIPKQNVKASKEEYRDKKYSATIFTIDDQVINNMKKSLISELKNNELLRTYIRSIYDYNIDEMKNISAYANSYADSLDFFNTFDSSQDFLDELIEELEMNFDDNEFNDTLYYTVFYDNRGNIIARRLRDKDNTGEIILGKFKENSESIFEFILNDLEENTTLFSLTNTIKKSGSIIDGDIKATINNNKFFSIKYNFDAKATINKIPVFVGEIKFSLDSSYVPITMTYTSEKNDDVLNSDLNINTEDFDFSMLIDTKFSSEVNLDHIKVDKNNELSQSELEDISLKILMKVMESPSISNLISELSGGMGNSYDDYNYDDYDDYNYGDYDYGDYDFGDYDFDNFEYDDYDYGDFDYDNWEDDSSQDSNY